MNCFWQKHEYKKYLENNNVGIKFLKLYIYKLKQFGSFLGTHLSTIVDQLMKEVIAFLLFAVSINNCSSFISRCRN